MFGSGGVHQRSGSSDEPHGQPRSPKNSIRKENLPNLASQRPAPCSRCQQESRLPGQRWGRHCLTEAQRRRRQQAREGSRVTPLSRAPATTCVTGAMPLPVTHPGVSMELCGHDALPEWPQGCGQLFPAKRPGQHYCCNLHGVGKPQHSDNCPLKEAPAAVTRPAERGVRD